MLNLFRVAITGGLSCGKSSVCRYFKELGAYTASADEIVHCLLSPKTDIGRQVVNLIGPDIVVDGQLDRSLIAKRAFDDSSTLKSLEALLHPAVREELEKEYKKAQQERAALFVAEIPLLFEAGWEVFFDYTIAVIADSGICRMRFNASKKELENGYDKRAAQQLDIEEKRDRADFTIVNNGTKAELKIKVREIFKKLVSLSLLQTKNFHSDFK